jgi:mono/diheme cytochrome c family protein
MSSFHRIAYLLLVTCAFLPVALAAQESNEHSPPTARKRSDPRPALNEQQRRGEALFVQNCPLCHILSNQKKALGILGPMLQGVYGEDADGDSLRQLIQQGVPGKMPGFRYDLYPKQIDDIIAYLKTGAYVKIPGASN